ncbi:MAG: EI24 domain-containing protein [bacterium]|nr:EI24 domain-containing protein [bacterium]
MRSVFTIVLGRRFFGTLRTAVIVNCLAFLAFAALFGFVLLPAFATDERHGTARWGVAAWLLLTPAILEILAGGAQNRLRLLTERIMLGEATTAPGKSAAARAGHRLATLVLSLVVLLTGLALVEVPWAGLPLTLLLGSALSGWVWFDATLARAAYDLPERATVIWRNRWRALGVGLGLAFCSAVPFLNLLLLPTVAAVATQSAFVRFDKRAATLPDSP